MWNLLLSYQRISMKINININYSIPQPQHNQLIVQMWVGQMNHINILQILHIFHIFFQIMYDNNLSPKLERIDF